MSVNLKLVKVSTNALFERIAIALESNKLPTVEDSVSLEPLALRYWEKEERPESLGLNTRVSNGGKNTRSVKREDIHSLINHFVQQKQSPAGVIFAESIRKYLRGEISASKLLGERDRRNRNGKSWQHYDKLGELAEIFIRNLPEECNFHVGNRSLIDKLDNNVYCLLSDLTTVPVDIVELKDRYKLPRCFKLEPFDTGFISPNQWRDYHQEFKRY